MMQFWQSQKITTHPTLAQVLRFALFQKRVRQRRLERSVQIQV